MEQAMKAVNEVSASMHYRTGRTYGIVRNKGSTVKTIKRAWLKFQIRSLEIQCDGMADALDAVRDPLTSQRITAARAVARRELARLRAKYNSTFPAGKRVVWGWA